jgi:hemolysin activation/secretion protein
MEISFRSNWKGFCILCWALLTFPFSNLFSAIVERQIQKEYETKPLEPKKEIPSIQIPSSETTLPLKKGSQVFIKSIEIHGNQSIPTWRICQWIGCSPKRKMDRQDIEKLCRIIEKNYAQRGFFFVHAFALDQKIVEGVLRIEIVEGKL